MVQDTKILDGLKADYAERCRQEKILYQQYYYFIDEGCRKYTLNYDDSFSAYSDALLSAIHNIVDNRFDGRSSIKTYLYQIFSNKCIDLVRKNTTNKQQVHKTMPVADKRHHSINCRLLLNNHPTRYRVSKRIFLFALRV